MQIATTSLPDVLVLTPQRHCDTRGHFLESWNRRTLTALGTDLVFVQENQSLSTRCGTIRGLHAQAPPHAQDKLVRCIRGSLLDVAVDIRQGSPTYGQWTSVELSADNAKQMLIPKGFLHGFVTTAPNTEILYKCTDHYAPETETAVHFADADIGIDWGIAPGDAITSEKDRSAPPFWDFDSPFAYSASAKAR